MNADTGISLTEKFTANDKDLQQPMRPKVLVFDIEYYVKDSLKLPTTHLDSILMISYIIDGRSYCLTNQDRLGGNVDSLHKLETNGPPITIWNVADEVAVIQKFVDHIKEECPDFCSGNNFDWKFLEERSKILGILLPQSLESSFPLV
jgi:DNA polymerase epsilon subunit 1